MATTSPALLLHNLTSPKAPLPIIASDSKSFILIFYRLNF